jgi:3-deoxy-manno-octulosonate cytidylyltransferase (CMP-KDO synthetase)
MSFCVLIPARMASSRLPDKPLADIAGLPMVVRVAQRAKLSAASRVVVAADDARVVVACQAHGIDAVLTRTDHPSGSDRLAEACDLLGLQDSDVVVNVQGDEPLIDPASIDAAAHLLQTRSDCSMSTLAHAIESVEDFANPNVVKVVLDARNTAMYFSRAPIAWWRDQRLTQPCPAAPCGFVWLPRWLFTRIPKVGPSAYGVDRVARTVTRLVARPPHCGACHPPITRPRCGHTRRFG